MITMSYRIQGGDFDSAGLATRMLKEQLARAGVGASAMRRVMIASYEAEMNVVIHARTGTLWARLGDGRLDLEIADEGPGIPDVECALQEGWSTASERARQMGFGAGMGLPNIRRNSDQFEIETRVGRGTRIRSTIMLDAPDAAAAGGPEPGTRMVAESGSVPLSPAVDRARCNLCMRCVEACPTGALRVRQGGPLVLEELCIGCAVCAAECPLGVYGVAEDPAADRDSAAGGTLAVLPRGFLSGLPVGGPGRVLEALRALGYCEVRLMEDWDTALRCAALAEARSRAAADTGTPASRDLPVIPPLCPAAVALVESRFPSLIPNLGAWLSPLEAAGEEFPLRPVAAVAACPAQYAAVRRESLTGRLAAVPAVRLAAALRPRLPASASVARPRAAPALPAVQEELRVSGACHVLRVLAEAEADRLPGVAVLGLFMCEAGCSGSPYLTADSFLSDQRWQAFVSTSPEPADTGPEPGAVARSRPYSQRRGIRLDPDMGRAIEKLARIDALARSLPGRDCGACGSPSCSAFAEDVILERAAGANCPHAREGVRSAEAGMPRGGPHVEEER
jgi:anti-sigma regulatory factor (Ser/Thr protein kinase)/Fe-S-cluster-containing hydrogenase component 2